MCVHTLGGATQERADGFTYFVTGSLQGYTDFDSKAHALPWICARAAPPNRHDRRDRTLSERAL